MARSIHCFRNCDTDKGNTDNRSSQSFPKFLELLRVPLLLPHDSPLNLLPCYKNVLFLSVVLKFKRDLLFILGFVLLPLVLYWPVTVGNKTMLPVDNLYQWQPWQEYAAASDATIPHNSLISDLILQNYNWRQFIRESLEQGELPLWNPTILSGTPFLAKGQHLAYYPFSLLFLILPLTKAYGWFTVSQLWLAGVLTYVLARVWGLRRSSAFLAGLVYQGCGFMLVSAAVFPMIIAAAAWLPLLLACIELIIRRTTTGEGGNTLPIAVLGSLALGCQILASHVEITYYTLLVMAFYTVWRGHMVRDA